MKFQETGARCLGWWVRDAGTETVKIKFEQIFLDGRRFIAINKFSGEIIVSRGPLCNCSLKVIDVWENHAPKCRLISTKNSLSTSTLTPGVWLHNDCSKTDLPMFLCPVLNLPSLSLSLSPCLTEGQTNCVSTGSTADCVTAQLSCVTHVMHTALPMSMPHTLPLSFSFYFGRSHSH